jgi:uncharacterized OB-fold protein
VHNPTSCHPRGHRSTPGQGIGERWTLGGDVPYGVGVVEFPEGIRVIGRLTESDPAALTSGQTMTLRVVPLHRDDDSNDVVTYAFAPAAS